MINEQNIFDQPVKSNLRTYGNIQKIVTGQGDGYKTSCLLDYNYFNRYYKKLAIDLSKQQADDADPKAIQQINFAENLVRDPIANTAMLFIIEEAKKTVLDFSQGTVKVFISYIYFFFYQLFIISL